MNKKAVQEKILTDSFIKICLVNFFIFVNFHALLPTFPFFITYLGGDAIAIGSATALFSIASIVSRPFVGWLVDSKGRCLMLVLGLIGLSICPIGYFISTGISASIIIRTCHGAFHAASSNASSTWVTDIIPRGRIGEGLGIYGLSMALSTAVAPALGLTIMNKLGFNYLFLMTSLVAIIALAIGSAIKDRNYVISSKPLKIQSLFEPISLPASITLFFFMIAYGVVEVYVAIYAINNNLPKGGIYFIFIAIATVLTRLALGKTIDKHGEGILVYSGNIAIIIGILLLVFVHNINGYIISALFLGYSFGAVQPALQTMAIHSVSVERRGAANSTFFIAFDLGIAIGGFVSGVLVKYLGYDKMFLIISFSCIISLAFYYIFCRNHISSFNMMKDKNLIE
ncbi:MAG: MFS transporter [Bacteroidales bacterium]|nr:MFS transporter [Bacteroidales bacterium]